MSRIKGITIELDGSTKGLDKALSDVNKRSKDLQSELKEVNRALKFNPGNTELLAQKQKLLGDQVENTKEKLKRLKDAQADVQAQFERGEIGEEQYRAFQREIVETESRLKHFERQLDSSKSKLESFGESVGKAGEKMKSVGDKMTATGKDLTKKVTAPIVGIAAAATMVGMNFEQSMSNVAAISGKTGDELQSLEDKAREMGASTNKSASEAADALSYMALAGWDTNEMLNGIEPILKLSSAGNIDLARTSDLVTDSMAALQMEVEELPEFLDMVARASQKSNTDIDALMEAFLVAGGTMASFNVPLEEATSILGIMANRGYKGAQAGTALNAIFTNLTSGLGNAGKAMDELGISAFDLKTGEFRGLEVVLQDLRKKFAGMTDEQRAQYISMIAGKEHLKTFNAILSGLGDEYGDLKGDVSSATGALDEMYKVMTDNLKGRWDEFTSALEEAGIAIFKNLQPAIEGLLGFLQGLADMFNGLSPAIQNVIVVIAGVVAAIGPVLVTLGILISSIGQIMTVIGPLLVTIAEAGGVIALLVNPITLVIAAVAALIAIFVALYKNNEEFRTKVQEIWAGIQENFQIALSFISELVSTIMTALTSFFGEQLAKIREFWNENGQQIMEIVSKSFQNVWTQIQLVMGLINGLFQAVWPIILHTVKNTWSLIQLVIGTALDIVLGIIKTVMKLIQGDWKGAWDSIKETAEQIWQNIEGFFADIDLYQIGADIIAGLIKGITSMIGSVRETVSSLAGNIPGWAKKVLGIASPSKVFAQIGEWTGEGLVQGMDATVHQIKRASERMAETSIPTVPKTSPLGFNPQGGSNGNGRGSVNNLNLEGLFKGAIFNVREEQDIEKIAKALNDYIKMGARKGGVVIP